MNYWTLWLRIFSIAFGFLFPFSLPLSLGSLFLCGSEAFCLIGHNMDLKKMKYIAYKNLAYSSKRRAQAFGKQDKNTGWDLVVQD